MAFEMLNIFTKIPEKLFGLIETAFIFAEGVAVMIIVFALIYGTVRYIVNIFNKDLTPRERFRQYKHGLAKSLLLSLEILVAADVIRTVALEPTLSNIAGLGLLVMIRTFLSWSLIVETEGHWPWQPKPLEE
jgi:uncharacterized membrane protein